MEGRPSRGVTFPTSFVEPFPIFLATLYSERGCNEVQIIDLYIIEKMQSQSPFSMASLIIKTIYNTGCDSTCKHVFHYPVLFSRIFQVLFVDFIGERREMTKKSHLIKFTTSDNYGYSYDKEKEEWIPPRLED